jgi:hypothetical protein
MVEMTSHENLRKSAFSSKQARINSLMSGLFERKMPLFS